MEVEDRELARIQLLGGSGSSPRQLVLMQAVVLIVGMVRFGSVQFFKGF
jgi:hypothetical protein